MNNMVEVHIDKIAEQALKICDKYGINHPGHREAFAEGYRFGVTEQSKIDIAKACEYCENNWEQYFKSRSDMKCFKGWLRKAMED